MLLTIDVGNTDVTIGVFNNNQLINKWRIATSKKFTEDEYASKILPFFQYAEIDYTEIDGAIISSVVRSVTKPMAVFIEKYIKLTPVIASEVEHDLNIKVDNPKKLGTDILANAIAVSRLYNENCIFINFGTALVIGVITKSKDLLGTLIMPGIQTALNELIQSADLLSHTNLFKPEHIIGKNTEDSIRSGMFYLYKESVSGIISNIKQDLGLDFKVVVTGGNANLVQSEIQSIDIFEQNLTLEGLKFLYEMHENKR
jgi:type III pantothenate kinase